MGNKDIRYVTVKHLITEGKIVSFNDIFKFVPKSIVAIDIGKKVDRFTELMSRVEGFTLEELFMIAELCEINEDLIYGLVKKDYESKKNKPKKISKSF